MSIEIIKRKNGEKSYRAVVWFFSRKKSKTFRRKLDAVNWERKAVHKDTLSPKTKLTVDEYFDLYDRNYMNIRLATSTKVMAKSLYNLYIKPHLGKKCLGELHTQHLRDYFLALSAHFKLTNERVNRVRRLLHAMFNRAVEWEIVATNPVSAIKQLPSKCYVGDQNINYLSQEDVTVLLSYLEESDPWLYPKIRILVNTGIRYGEMAALQVSDFRKSSQMLLVSRSYCRYSYEIKDRTKGNKSRSIPLGQGLQKLLSTLSDRKAPNDPLIWNTWVEGKHQTKLTKHFNAALKGAGLRKIRVHDLRHTFAVHFLENGGQLYDLQKILGHHSIQLTERYSHFSLAMSERSRGIVDHHGNPRIIQPKFTVIDGGLPATMSHNCPINAEVKDAGTDHSSTNSLKF